MSVTAAVSLPSRLAQYYALTKPRVVQLIVFCALIGMVLAVPGVPTLDQLLDRFHNSPSSFFFCFSKLFFCKS